MLEEIFKQNTRNEAYLCDFMFLGARASEICASSMAYGDKFTMESVYVCAELDGLWQLYSALWIYPQFSILIAT